jgi:hypothetical protein
VLLAAALIGNINSLQTGAGSCGLQVAWASPRLIARAMYENFIIVVRIDKVNLLESGDKLWLKTVECSQFICVCVTDE